MHHIIATLTIITININYIIIVSIVNYLSNHFETKTFNGHIRELSLALGEISTSRTELDDSVRDKLCRCEGVLQEAKDVKNVGKRMFCRFTN